MAIPYNNIDTNPQITISQAHDSEKLENEKAVPTSWGGLLIHSKNKI